ncbi:hypothetical protein [Citrifermentans bremense]|uniref:hypothetical protein n=1 Tax=Citrifermentans bremense TaxID=60035 RepID=UPI00047D65C9|nr:hypothetical protein [Citrifermentans bremense]
MNERDGLLPDEIPREEHAPKRETTHQDNGLLPDEVPREHDPYFEQNYENLMTEKPNSSPLLYGDFYKKSKWYNSPEYETVNQLQKISTRLDDILLSVARASPKGQVKLNEKGQICPVCISPKKLRQQQPLSAS